MKFDCTAVCDDTPQADRDKCGHAKRLDDWLDATHAPDDHYVKNRGWGGEETDEALTRFPGEMDTECPGSPGDCISIILMHGTNDMSGSVSPESARANLGLIVDEAKSRNLDVLLMTIIRRGSNPGGMDKWEDYKDEVLDLAMDEDLQSVNPWATLCDTANCVDDNYWMPGEPPCFDPNATPDPGHLDPDGYDELTDLIKAVFPAAEPAKPAPTAPAGIVTDTTPSFTWPEVPDTRWYELDLDAGTITWWEGAAHCGGGTCTANPGVALAPGAHTWKVRGRNLLGMGAWSEDTAFEIWTTVPDEAIPTGPTGVHFEPWVPLYEWLPAAGATKYNVRVKDMAGNTDYNAPGLLASATCADGVCSHLGTALPDSDVYSLQVVARNGIGAAPGALNVSFTFLECLDDTEKDLQALEPGPVTTTETVDHCGPVTAGAMGPYEVSAGGDLTVRTRDGFTAADDFTVRGELTIISP